MVGYSERFGMVSRLGRRVAAAVLLLGAALAGPSCSSDGGAPTGNGDVPPPLSQPCDSDLDCSAWGLKCDPLRGCLACVFDWHCADGERCTADGCQRPASCTTDSDCVSQTGAPHCDPVISECVGCRFEADCPANSHCTERSCTSYTACVNTRDCPEGTVCNRDAGECVECLQNGDCEEGKEVCVATHCVPVCQSDKDCIDRNQLCHHEKGYCADCVEQEDCPNIYYCDQDLCKLDVCKVGSTTCMGSTSLGTCNALGSGYDSTPCPVSTTCAEAGGAATCQPWVCTPGTSDCDPTGVLLRLCAQDGLSVASETDCSADGQLCHMAQCKPKVCEPGSLYCQGNEARECLANGTESLLKSTCPAGQYCVDGQGTCAIQACVPDSVHCLDNNVTVCDAIGSAYLPDVTDCTEEDAACFDGECLPIVCDGAFCEDDSSWSCLDNGTRAELNRACLSNEYCSAGFCTLDTCTPGQLLCAGNVATTCNAEGSGSVPGGTDCSAENKACVTGACLPIVCQPNSYYCLNGNPQRCNAQGTGPSQQSDTCSDSEYCSPGDSTCNYDVCTAGAKFCNDNVVATCAADGSGAAPGGEDCAATNKVCVSGTCLPKVCEPSQYFCQTGNLYYCGATGASSSLQDTCLASEHCNPAFTTCRPDVCTGGAPTCNGDLLSTCAADGSGPADAGVACANGQICHAGACKPVVCTLDAYSCITGNVNRCIDKGTAWSVYQTCLTATYCNELADPIVCSADTCTPAGNACNGEKLATCDADGGHFSATSTDCSLTNKVCSLTGACLDVAEDTVGDLTTPSTVSSYLAGNVFRVDRARTLTEIEQYVSVTGTSVFTWVVYSGDSYTGSFTKVSETTTSSSGSGVFHSSGAISVPLQAGKYYLIGVIVQGSHTRYYVNSAARGFVSFGQLWNAYSVSSSSAAAGYNVTSSNFRYYQRLSTADAP